MRADRTGDQKKNSFDAAVIVPCFLPSTWSEGEEKTYLAGDNDGFNT
jgi:hypothetical protein